MKCRIWSARIVCSTIIICAALVMCELGSAWVHFQHSAERGSALVWSVSRAFDLWERVKTESENRAMLGNLSERQVEEALFSPIGATVLDECEDRYRSSFQALASSIEERNGKIIILYVPSENFSHAYGRAFFKSLSEKYNIAFVDVTGVFSAYPREITFLLPVDSHPSRFGHRLIADMLVAALEPLQSHRAFVPSFSSLKTNGDAVLLGDYPRQMDQIMLTNPGIPYRMRTNAQGLRMDREVPLAPQEQVVLLLGDSVTSGSSVPVEDIYATRIANLLSGRIVVNAGVGGYGIEEERDLFEERMHSMRTDIVVLQVLDNDLSAFLWFKTSNRHNNSTKRQPTKAEQIFIKEIVTRSVR